MYCVQNIISFKLFAMFIVITNVQSVFIAKTPFITILLTFETLFKKKHSLIKLSTYSDVYSFFQKIQNSI